MKWKKFQAFVANNLNLAQVIDWHIGPPAGLKDEQVLRTWIEDKVEYIAVRPWESLDLDAKSAEELDLSREYSVWFQIGNQQGTLHWRLKGFFTDNLCSPVSELMAELRVWHGEYWAKQPGDHPLVIEAVTCHEKTWTRNRFLDRESLDIYIPPKGYTP